MLIAKEIVIRIFVDIKCGKECLFDFDLATCKRARLLFEEIFIIFLFFSEKKNTFREMMILQFSKRI